MIEPSVIRASIRFSNNKELYHDFLYAVRNFSPYRFGQCYIDAYCKKHNLESSKRTNNCLGIECRTCCHKVAKEIVKRCSVEYD